MREKSAKALILRGNGSPFKAKKVGRNEPCPCKSGLKNKNCCKIETEYYKTK